MTYVETLMRYGALAVGALGGLAKLNLGWAHALGRSLVADVLWYAVGRRLGGEEPGMNRALEVWS